MNGAAVIAGVGRGEVVARLAGKAYSTAVARGTGIGAAGAGVVGAEVEPKGTGRAIGS